MQYFQLSPSVWLVVLLSVWFSAVAAFAQPPDHAQWELTFQDEFDGERVDWDVWESQAGPRGATKLESRWPENNELRDGILYQVTRHVDPPRGGRQWTTAHIMTRHFRQQYGYFEARMRYGRYLNNAFWLFRPEGARFPDPPHFEIDVNEGHTPRELAMTLHFFMAPEPGADVERFSTGMRWNAPMDLDADFHLYGVEWNKDELIWYFDGKPVRRLANPNAHAPADVRLSTVIMPRQLQRDKVALETMDGVSMAVDWVRVYRKTADLHKPDLPPLETYQLPKVVQHPPQVSTTGNRTLILEQDFQSATPGALPAGWQVGAGQPEVIASHIGGSPRGPHEGNHVLRLQAQDYAFLLFDQPERGRFEVEFDYFSGEPGEGLLLSTLGRFDASDPRRRETSYYTGDIGAYLHWNRRFITYYTEAEHWTRIARWKLKQWSRVRLLFDVSKQAFDLYAGEDGTEFVSSGVCRHKQDAAFGIALRHRGDGYPVYLDNLTIRRLDDTP